MKFYNLLFAKSCFDKGMSLMYYLKYVILAVGIASRDVMTTIWLGVGYVITSGILGFIWFHYNLADAEKEVMNRYDPFVKEMREKFK